MKKLLLFICMLTPISVYAGTREIDIWSDYSKLIQPIPKTEINQDGMRAQYIANEKTLTDKIVYTI